MKMSKEQKERIETFARQIAPLIGHLSDSEFDAVIDRAEEIARGCGEGMLAQARDEEALSRLAKAAGCPPGVPVIPWLAERGLIEKTPRGGGWIFKAAKPVAVR